MPIKHKHFVDLVKVAMDNKASDIHIRTDEAPALRIKGELIPIKSNPLSKDDVQSIAKFVMGKQAEDISLDEIQEFDGGHELAGICRLRFNLVRFQEKLGIIFRLISNDIPTTTELGLPKAIEDIAEKRRGLVLITGATGSGKSTTLTAMIDYINHHRRCHIVTLEDPVEFVHQSKKSKITQRQIGADTKDFNTALRSALRQDPDVISIGEMRDAETASIAMKAAETGHLVLGTIHTTDAEATINRFISLFPPEEQRDARLRFSDALAATISQRLLKGDKGAVVCFEIMVNSPGIQSCILGKEDMTNLYTYIMAGKGPGGNGSQSFEQHLKYLLKNKIITKKAAMDAAANASDFAKSLEFER